MTMQAHFEEPAEIGEERRGSARRALMLDAETAGARHDAAQVTIHDLSLTGVLIETSTPLVQGETFEVDLSQVGKAEATVVWASGEFYGCAFREPISTAALSAAILRSAPREVTSISPSLAADLVAELRHITGQVEKIAGEVERAIGKLAGDHRGNH
jgi:PilZ domain